MNTKTNTFCFYIILSLIFFVGLSIQAEASTDTDTVDHSLYARLLIKYNDKGIVDYKGFKNEESKLDRYLKILKETDTNNLPREEQLAFYLNAYNACTIKLILSAYPGVKSIKDLGNIFRSPWKKKICSIDGDRLTLDHIEHGIIRPRFKDPRAHFAVNCASKGCPPLRAEPYQGNILNQQLDDSTRTFINDPQRYRIEYHTLYVNEIFKWFSEDFDNDIIGFYLIYAEGDLKNFLESNKGKIKIDYYDYDWSLNEK